MDAAAREAGIASCCSELAPLHGRCLTRCEPLKTAEGVRDDRTQRRKRARPQFRHVRRGLYLDRPLDHDLVSISEEKTTKIGTGHFITTVGEYRNQRGELVARSTNVLFRYRAV